MKQFKIKVDTREYTVEEYTCKAILKLGDEVVDTRDTLFLSEWLCMSGGIMYEEWAKYCDLRLQVGNELYIHYYEVFGELHTYHTFVKHNKVYLVVLDDLRDIDVKYFFDIIEYCPDVYARLDVPTLESYFQCKGYQAIKKWIAGIEEDEKAKEEEKWL